jgi:hypothetical protein
VFVTTADKHIARDEEATRQARRSNPNMVSGSDAGAVGCDSKTVRV